MLKVYVILLLWAVLMLVRNQWVFNRRIELNRFEGDEHVLGKYISYNAMMLRFWVWDIEKLKIKQENTE